MSGPLGGTSASGGGVSGSQTNAPRRRRKNQSSRGNRSQSGAAHPNQMGYPSGPTGHQQFGGAPPRGGPNGPLNNQMPPPGMLPHPPQTTGMGWGLSIDEDPMDFILDDLDKLSGRDIASARYRRNHELINLIFDARKIESLQPSISPYAEKDQDALRSQLAETQDSIQNLQNAHSTKFRRWREELQEHDDLLHAPPKRIKVQLEEREKQKLEEANLEEVNANGQPVAPWTSKPSEGNILGSGYIRATTPEEVRKLLPKAPEPEPEPEQKPVVPAATQSQPTALGPTVSPEQAVSGAPQSMQTNPQTSSSEDSSKISTAVQPQQATATQPGQSAEPPLPQSSNPTDEMQLDVTNENVEEAVAEGEEEGSGQDDDVDDEDDGDADADDDDEDAEADADGDADADAEGDADETDAKPKEDDLPTNDLTLESIAPPQESPQRQADQASTEVADASMAALGDDTFATAADESQDAIGENSMNADGIASTSDVEVSTNDVIAKDDEPESEKKDIVQKSMDAVPPVESTEPVTSLESASDVPVPEPESSTIS